MKPHQIVAQLEHTIGLAGAPIKLEAAIERELRASFGMLAIQAAEKASGYVPSVAKLIAELAAHHDDSGTIATLSLVGTTADIVCGSCHEFPTDVAPVAIAKRNRAHAVDILSAIRGLTFNQFEKFGACVLRALGVRQATVTPHANDQGIDFYGYFSVGQLEEAPAPFFKLAHDVSFALAGQAKHYPTRPVGTATVRELIGSISLARTKTYSNDSVELFENVPVKPFSPMMAMLFTTGEFTNGAKHLCDAAGVVAKNGAQLSVYLAEKGVGIEGQGDTSKFSLAAFMSWLGN